MRCSQLTCYNSILYGFHYHPVLWTFHRAQENDKLHGKDRTVLHIIHCIAVCNAVNCQCPCLILRFDGGETRHPAIFDLRSRAKIGNFYVEIS